MTAVPPIADEVDAAPSWFVRATAAVPDRRWISVAGARIHYRAWGPDSGPGVVLVHGGAAHSGWWDHVAPLLAGYRVLAPDLSGYGDSEHRPAYDIDLWAREIVGVAAAEGLRKPVVIGHSKGGWLSIATAADHGEDVGAVVAIDSPLHVEPPSEEWLRRRQRPHRHYPSREAAAARFVTLPPQDLVLPYVRRHVAAQSVRPAADGWTWKFDPRSFTRIDDERALLARVRIPFAYFRCEHGLVSDEGADALAAALPYRPPVVTLAESGHHPMLDHPLSLVAALRTLLAVWPGGRR